MNPSLSVAKASESTEGLSYILCEVPGIRRLLKVRERSLMIGLTPLRTFTCKWVLAPCRRVTGVDKMQISKMLPFPQDVFGVLLKSSILFEKQRGELRPELSS